MTSACASASPPLCPVPLIQCVQREEGARPRAPAPGLGMDEALGPEGVGGGCRAFRQSGPLVSFPEVSGQALGSWGRGLGSLCPRGLCWGLRPAEPTEGRGDAGAWGGPARCWGAAVPQLGLEPGILLGLCHLGKGLGAGMVLPPGNWGGLSQCSRGGLCLAAPCGLASLPPPPHRGQGSDRAAPREGRCCRLCLVQREEQRFREGGASGAQCQRPGTEQGPDPTAIPATASGRAVCHVMCDG